MMKFLAACALLVLGGCGSVSELVNPPYVPQPIRILDQVQYNADVEECLLAGNNFKPGMSLGTIATSTFTGATTNLSLVPFNAAVPAYGAIGGAANAISNGLDVMSSSHRNVAKNCLRDETLLDHSAIIANPDN